MADTCHFPVALRWDQGPENLRKLKTKLLLYFSTNSKSDGGECQLLDTDCSHGHILIHFKEETARDQVLKKQSHVIKLNNGKILKLEVFPAEAEKAGSSQKPPSPSHPQDAAKDSGAGGKSQQKGTGAPNYGTPQGTPDPPSSSSSLVLIENIQDDYSPEVLQLLVENISQANEDSFHVERIPEIQSAVINFSRDIDISSFIQNFERSPRAKNLSAKPLKESRTIRAEGLPANASEDYLTLYFEKPNVGGPNSVEAITVIPEEEAALVTFTNVQSAKKVLTMKHEFCKKELFVYPYYHSHDMVLYGKEKPHIEKPKPLTFSVSPYILEFLLKDTQLKDTIEKTMMDLKCEIKWPDGFCPNPVITLCFPDALTSHFRTMAKVAPTWKKTVHDQFSKLISDYKVIEYDINQRAWEAISEHVKSSTYNGVLIQPDFAAGKVFLAGNFKDVTKLDPVFRKMVEETTKKVERSYESVTEAMPVSPVFYQIICNSGLLTKILMKVPELKIDYNKSKKELHLHGLKEEVLNAQCDMLSLTRQLKSKFIQMDYFLIQFLMSTDNEELSCLLFVCHNINAQLEVDNNSPKLTAYSNKDLTEAEEQIRKELVMRQIRVEDKSLLRGPEWRSLICHLTDSLNVENCTVLILECPSGADNDVVITGLSSSIHQCHQQVSDFLEKNTRMEKIFQLKSLAVMQFLKEENKQLWNDLKKVKVTMNNKKINLRGGKLYVTEAASILEGILSSLFSDTLLIDKPGAKKLWLAEEAMYVMTAKNKYKTIICLQKEEDQADEVPEVPQSQVMLPNGVLISVCKGDLCHLNVDAIVNAANEDLKHCGGLALALLKAAGPKLQEDCNQIVMKEGPLSAGEAVITASGRLPCKQVIHAVGPRWNPRSPDHCERLLRKAISTSLELAEEAGHTSIAFPAISAGIYGFPVDKCAEAIVKSIKQYFEQNHGGTSTIKQIRLVDTNEDTTRTFTSMLRRQFGQEEDHLAPDYQHGRADARGTYPKLDDFGVSGNQMTTKENIVIRIREGLIQEAATDMVVNSVGKDLDLDSGGASRSLSERAGRRLQQYLNQASSGIQVKDGSIFITEGCNLPCSFVIHTVVPEWDSGKGSSEKIFREIVSSCISKTEEKQKASITFPAIGTGILGFPKSTVATLMFEVILEFSSKKKAKHLKEVNFILNPNDRDTMVEFSKELTKWSRHAMGTHHDTQASARAGTDTGSKAGAAVFGPVKRAAKGIHEMMIGSILYQVKVGDITKENTNIIVNSTDPTFTMKSGVSKAILEAAGQSVENECARLGSQGKTLIVTQNGNLLCKKIIHAVAKTSADGIRHTIIDVLTECAQLQASSVAFPAIGTGVGNISPEMAADSILEAVAQFDKSPHSIQTVKVIIFQQQMLNDFCTSMKKKEGSPLPQKEQSFRYKIDKASKSMASTFKGLFRRAMESEVFELSENIEPAIFHLCAESQKHLSDAKSWLQDLTEREQIESVITDDWIQEFSDNDQDALIQLQKKNGVRLMLDLCNFTIKVLGLSKDVLEVTNKIQNMIKAVREKKTQEREAELSSHVVEWRYDNGTKCVPFDKMINMELEKARAEACQSVTVNVNGVQYTVIIESDVARSAGGDTMKIQRILKNELIGVPQEWDPMKNNSVLVVPLNPGRQEYKDVGAHFQKTCPMRIIKIERIQNRPLWMSYQVKKQSIDGKNASTEKQLFHGCDANAIKSVNQYGFNRSYAGKNAAYYGDGTYFAVEARYSAQDTYSKPDANGNKHMYLSRVVTGVTAIGKQGMVVPPPKDPANPTDLCDSVSDNPTNPVMYVIFNDIQAYPEYLITFK